MLTLTQADLAAVFAEWLRRYKADPAGTDLEAAFSASPEHYGEACAAHVMELHQELTDA